MTNFWDILDRIWSLIFRHTNILDDFNIQNVIERINQSSDNSNDESDSQSTVNPELETQKWEDLVKEDRIKTKAKKSKKPRS